MTLNDLQYPFFVLATTGSFMVTSKSRRVRFWAFVAFCLSNVCMITWSVAKGDSWGVFATNVLFEIAAVRGVITHRKGTDGE